MKFDSVLSETAIDLDKNSFTFEHLFEKSLKNCSKNSENCIYLCGNSLGLMPTRTRALVNQELDVWSNGGVTGHFDHEFNRPWVTVDNLVREPMAKVVGALTLEVVVMNSLTANLHFLMVPFYRPTATRFKILMEAKAFPSDYFAFESQVRFHGLDPATAIIQVSPKNGAHTIDTEDIIQVLNEQGESIALVLFSGVQYYTAQLFDIEKITKVGQSKGCIVGWDLAHAAGNVLLNLHSWNVDFACWCSYKYLNAGPGGIGGAFVHERHFLSPTDAERPMFSGWWGTQEKTKFEMDLTFRPIPDAYRYRVSNPSVLSIISLKASLDIFEQTNMATLVAKSHQLTGYLEYLIDTLIPADRICIITPRNAQERGAQLSLLFLVPGEMEKVFKYLGKAGVVCDDRKPDVIRVAPAPLYNTFQEVWRAVHCIKEGLEL